MPRRAIRLPRRVPASPGQLSAYRLGDPARVLAASPALHLAPAVRVARARASIASVPSIASTASTIPCCTTQPCPTSARPNARVTSAPRAMSAIAAASGATRPNTPRGPTASVSTSCAPITRNPSSPSTRTSAASSPSSPVNAARPIRARMRAPSASGRRSSNDGRRTGPTSTTSAAPMAAQRRQDFTGGTNADDLMRMGGDQCGLRKAAQCDDKYRPPCRHCRRGNTPRKMDRHRQ